MWNGYCGNLIRRANRNLLIAIVCVAALCALFLFYKRTYLAQFVQGARNVTAAQVVEKPAEDQFVRIHVDRAIFTGLQHTTKQKSGAVHIDSQYFATLISGKLLILRIPNGENPDEIRDLTFEGRVRPLTTELSSHLRGSLGPDIPPVADYYIDGEDYRELGIMTLVFGIPLLAFWLWMLWRYLQGSGDFARHGFAKRLAKYGPLEMIVQEIDSEMAAIHSTYSHRSITAEITQNWLLTRSLFSGDAIRLNHLVWAYQYLLKKKAYFVVTVNKSYFVYAFDDLGKKIQIQLSQEKVNDVLRELSAKAPQAILGFHKEIQKIWNSTKKDPSRFLLEARSLAGQTDLSTERTGSAPLR